MDPWTTHCLDLFKGKKVLQAMGHGERIGHKQAPIIKSTRPTYRQIMLNNVFGDLMHDKGRMVNN
jgi:hypothetical protein